MQVEAAGAAAADAQGSAFLLLFQLSVRGPHLKAAGGAVRGGSTPCEELSRRTGLLRNRAGQPVGAKTFQGWWS